jgi:NAD(P)-dependent dehydrogenase (short-subunit alcohol dehydrogenase family)
MKEPSILWCIWQALMGTNFRQLNIPDADLRHKWVVLTGGNSGIGREAALQFSKWGANVVLGCRHPPPHEPHPDTVVEECKAAAMAAGHQDTIIEWWECDMGSLSSVEAFGKRWLAKDLPLNILANNAGMPGSTLGTLQLTEDGFEIVHQVSTICPGYHNILSINHPAGELPCACFVDHGGPSIDKTSPQTSDHLHNIMYAISREI